MFKSPLPTLWEPPSHLAGYTVKGSGVLERIPSHWLIPHLPSRPHSSTCCSMPIQILLSEMCNLSPCFPCHHDTFFFGKHWGASPVSPQIGCAQSIQWERIMIELKVAMGFKTFFFDVKLFLQKFPWMHQSTKINTWTLVWYQLTYIENHKVLVGLIHTAVYVHSVYAGWTRFWSADSSESMLTDQTM